MSKKTVSGIILTLLFIGMLTLASNTQQVEAPSDSSSTVGGYVSQDTTWTLDGSPYIVVEDVIVEPGVTLTIEPGVVVKFTSGTNLMIDGALVAKGNTTHPITFTSNSTTPQPGDWGSIEFRDSSDDSLCRVSYCIIQYGSTGILALDASPRISYCNISNNFNYGISLCPSAYSSTIISHNIVLNNGFGLPDYSCGIKVEGRPGSFVSIYNNDILSNGGDGLYIYTLGGGSIRVEYNEIVSNKRYGIYSYFSSAVLVRNTISRNLLGGIFVVSYNSGNVPIIHYNNIVDNGYCDGDGYYGYDLRAGSYDINATYNWWGTTNETKIDKRIYDYYDDYHYGRVFYKPYLIPPVANFSFSPETPYAYGTITFDASASFNPYGSIINYTWDFGDGNITTVTSPIITHTYTKSGNFNVTLAVTDEFGLTNSTTTTITVLQDKSPPVTTDNYDGLWHNTDFIITLTATDNETGVAETYYKINSGPVKAVSVDGQPVITTEGANNTLEYWSVDYAGNKEEHYILTGIKLDKTSPLITSHFRFPDDNVEPNEPVKVAVNVTDFLSDVKNCTVSYRIAGESTWINIPMTLNQTTMLYEAFIQIQEPNVEVEYRIIAYDNAGNVALEDNNGQYYTYTVIPEFPSITTLLLMLIVLSIIVSVKRKVLRKFPT